MPVAARVVGDVRVAAFGAGRHMPAEGNGPTGLDRGHHFELRQVQVPCVVPAVGRPMGAENIRDLQFGAGHRSRDLSGTSLPANQQIKRAGDIPDHLGRKLRIDRRRFQLGVPQQHLNDPDVGPAFEQMRREAVAQGMG